MIDAWRGYLREISEICEMCCATRVAAEFDTCEICEISFRTGRHRLRQAIDSGRRPGGIYSALDPLHTDSRRRGCQQIIQTDDELRLGHSTLKAFCTDFAARRVPAPAQELQHTIRKLNDLRQPGFFGRADENVSDRCRGVPHLGDN